MKKKNSGSRSRRTGRVESGRDPGSEKAGYPMRLNRFIARSGVCSRREADTLITGGKVRVNGEKVINFGTRVSEGDKVHVNGKLITPVVGVYLLLNKPTGTITTKSDEKGRSTVLDLVDLEPDVKSALFPVGRLDRETSGVLLLTSDGTLAHRLMHPSFEVEKLYKVRTEGPVPESDLDKLREGVALEDGPGRADMAAYTDPPGKHEIGVAMHSGRNRVVRRMFEALGHEVKALERVRYAGLTASGVRRGKWRRLEKKEIERLYRAVKLKV
jgi:23S rRNA pseudouridine2605 synthase